MDDPDRDPDRDPEREALEYRAGWGQPDDLDPDRAEKVDRRLNDPPDPGDWYYDVANGELFQVIYVRSWSESVEEAVGYICEFIYEDGTVWDEPADNIRDSDLYIKVDRPEWVEDLKHIDLGASQEEWLSMPFMDREQWEKDMEYAAWERRLNTAHYETPEDVAVGWKPDADDEQGRNTETRECDDCGAETWVVPRGRDRPPRPNTLCLECAEERIEDE